MTWAKNGTPDTLGSAGDVMTISDLTKSIFNQFMTHTFGTGGDTEGRLRLGSGSVDTGSNYADRFSSNGGADSTQTSQDDMHVQNYGTFDGFAVGYIIDITAEEKLVISHSLHNSGAGAANAPGRFEAVNKWANTSAQFDNIQSLNVAAGSFDTSSNISALGTD